MLLQHRGCQNHHGNRYLHGHQHWVQTAHFSSRYGRTLAGILQICSSGAGDERCPPLSPGLYPLVGWKIGSEVVYLAEGNAADTGTAIHWAQKLGESSWKAAFFDCLQAVGLIKKSSCETMATGSTGFVVWRCCRALHGCSGHQRHGLQRHRLRRCVFRPILQRPAGTGACTVDTFAVSVLSRIFDHYNNIIPCRCWIFSMFCHKNGPRLRVNSSQV